MKAEDSFRYSVGLRRVLKLAEMGISEKITDCSDERLFPDMSRFFGSFPSCIISDYRSLVRGFPTKNEEFQHFSKNFKLGRKTM